MSFSRPLKLSNPTRSEGPRAVFIPHVDSGHLMNEKMLEQVLKSGGYPELDRFGGHGRRFNCSCFVHIALGSKVDGSAG